MVRLWVLFLVLAMGCPSHLSKRRRLCRSDGFVPDFDSEVGIPSAAEPRGLKRLLRAGNHNLVYFEIRTRYI